MNMQKEYCGIVLCGVSTYLNNMYMRYPQNAINKTSSWDMAYFIQLTIYPIILVIGTVLNACAFAVFRRPVLKPSPISRLLTILADLDTLSLIIG